jgi:plastocyanin
MILTTALLAAAALGAGSLPAKSDEVGSISGHILWEGERPAPKPDLVMDEKATAGCKHGAEGMNKKDDTLVIGDNGGVKNVVLTIEVAGAERKVPAEPVAIDQSGCRFDPHVVVLPVGATLRFHNTDGTNHNIHTFAKKNQSINKNVAQDTHADQLLDKAEVIDVKCDIHPWMKGFVVVTDATHWAITGADGAFKIEGLPPGEYEVSWWHEELNKGKTEKIKVEAGKDTPLEHKISAEKKGGGARRR